MRHFASLAAVAILGLTLAGCSGDGRTAIHGAVTLDGNPVEDGTIKFLPADGQGPSAAARVEKGQYSLRLMPGKKKVKIEGYKTVGHRHHNDQPDAPLLPVKEPIVPPKFNRNSQLTCEVTSGTHKYDFDLKTN